MSRLALITLHTPTATNFRGASALSYHLLAYRPKGMVVEIWTFNLNRCSAKQIEDSEQCLGVRIHVIDKPVCFNVMGNALVRLMLPKPRLSYLKLPKQVVRNISQYLGGEDSALWIYGEDIAHMANVFSNVRTVVTTPDCEAMYYYRVLGMKGLPLRKSALFRYTLMYHRYAKMVAAYPAGDNIVYHMVGMEDLKFFNSLNPEARAVFIRHPHYNFSSACHAQVDYNRRIKLLIAGSRNFTMAQAADVAVSCLAELSDGVKSKYLITFLGRGWEADCRRLVQSGCMVEQIEYVDDYAAEVASHNIQLTPVSVGTGTKGKVLDAFVNGLMVIGTPLALENIAVIRNHECVEYTSGTDLSEWLTRLADNPAMIDSIAQAGRDAVLRKHGREVVAEQFFSLFKF